jgi:hypothetical protein
MSTTRFTGMALAIVIVVGGFASTPASGTTPPAPRRIQASLHTKYESEDFSQVRAVFGSGEHVYTCKSPTESTTFPSGGGYITRWVSVAPCTSAGMIDRHITVTFNTRPYPHADVLYVKIDGFAPSVTTTWLFTGTAPSETFAQNSAGYTEIWSKTKTTVRQA